MIKVNFQSPIKWFVLVIIALLLGSAGVFIGLALQTDSTSTESLRMGIVDRVVDGDTIKLTNGEVIRYLDIDAPETKHPDKPVECYGHEASDRNKELVEGQTVYLDVPENVKDTYGRTLAYVYSDEYFVNGELVWSGYAYARSYGDRGRLYQTLIQLERAAREAGRGLWGHCN